LSNESTGIRQEGLSQLQNRAPQGQRTGDLQGGAPSQAASGLMGKIPRRSGVVIDLNRVRGYDAALFSAVLPGQTGVI